MAGERWGRARDQTKPSAHKKREAAYTFIGAVAVAALTLPFGDNRFFILYGGALGGLVGFALSIYWPRWMAYLHDPRVQLEARVAQLEARPSNASAFRPDAPPPDFRPEIREANEMLELPYGDRDVVDAWIDRVYYRLFDWNVGIAIQFRPAQMVASADSVANREQWNTSPLGRPPLEQLLGKLGTERINPPPLQFDPELMRLKTHRDSLLELVPQ